MSSMYVLVTGGSGFIGSHVVDQLLAAGHRPRILDTRASPWHHDDERVEEVLGDIRSLEDVSHAINGCDAVCHLAAAADVGEVQLDPAGSTELNAMGTLNVLEAARLAGVQRVVYASTVWVYSDVVADEVDEETALRHPAHVYTAGKLSGELFCRSYAELYDLQPTVLRFGIPYGPRARPAAVIPSFVERALRGEQLSIAGTGEQERSFVYVEDLAEGVVRGLRPEAAGRTYNLAGRETTTIRELADIVANEIGSTEIVHTPGRAGDLRGAVVRSELAERELGWQASTPLVEGVRRYVEWRRHEASAPEPVADAGPARVSGARRATRKLAAMAADPVLVGLATFLAVASATVSVVLGTDDRAEASALVVLGVALLLPIWTLTVALWPAERRRAQTAATALFGAFSVLILGVLSAGEVVTLSATHSLPLLVLSAAASSALRVLPARMIEQGSQ